MKEHRQILAIAELEHGRQGLMVRPRNLSQREVGQIVVAQQKLANPPPERIPAIDDLDMVDGIAIGGIEAANTRSQPLPLFF
jgi:hypothetical protein